MAEPKLFRLVHQQSRINALDAVSAAPLGTICILRDPTRTEMQNDKQWPILRAFSRQLKWPVNGLMTDMTEEEWKDVLTAAFKNETIRLAMGLNGGVVMIGKRTSKFTVKEFSEWIEFLYSVAAERGVNVDEF